jgi:hypothetical protein
MAVQGDVPAMPGEDRDGCETGDMTGKWGVIDDFLPDTCGGQNRSFKKNSLCSYL